MKNESAVIVRLQELASCVRRKEPFYPAMEENILAVADTVDGDVFSRVLEIFIMVDLGKDVRGILDHINELIQHLKN